MLNPISSTINRHKKRRDSSAPVLFHVYILPQVNMKNTDFVHGWITIESFEKTWLRYNSIRLCLSDPWKMPKNAMSFDGFSMELMTPEVNGKSLFLVDKTASHSNYTPIPSHEILVGSWLCYGLSTRLLFSSIIWIHMIFHVSCLKHL